MDFSALNATLTNHDPDPGDIKKQKYRISVLNEAGRTNIIDARGKETEPKSLDMCSNALPLLMQYLPTANKASKESDNRDEVELLVFKQKRYEIMYVLLTTVFCKRMFINNHHSCCSEELSAASILTSLQGIAWNRDWDWTLTRICEDRFQNDFDFQLSVERDEQFAFKSFEMSEEPRDVSSNNPTTVNKNTSSAGLKDWIGSLGGGDSSLISVAPGLEKGLCEETIVTVEDKPDLSMTLFNSYSRSTGASKRQDGVSKDSKVPESDIDAVAATTANGDIDGILEDAGESLTMILGQKKQAAAEDGSAGNKTWAHVIDVSTQFINFKELVPDMAHSFPFELDTFQKHAVYHLEKNESVFVAAHTSAGKTVVAEYAVALAKKHMTK